MPTCPAGHSSGADDYCDVCGTRMTGTAGGAPAGSSPGSRPSAGPPGTGGPGETCPDCSTPRTGRFCEGCGYDFAVGTGRPGSVPSAPPPIPSPPPPVPSAPPPVPVPDEPVTGPMRTGPTGAASGTGPAGPASGTWTAVVVADRDYYETVLRQSGDGAAFTFPPYCPERRIPLDRPQVRIGRR